MKTLKKYTDFLLEKMQNPIMKYYAFDMDDNLLMMPTVIHMEHLVDGNWVKEDVSTETFAKVRNEADWKPLVEHGELLAYYEFRDHGPRGNQAFMQDMLKAIETKSFGPSWNSFLKCLKDGSIFSIITARGHEPDTLRKGVEYIINTILTQEDRTEMVANLTAFQDMFVQNFDIMRDISEQTLISAYLDKCDFIGVSAPSFSEKFPGIDASNPEEGKKAALNEFIDRINAYGAKVDGDVRLGFSDDDPKTVHRVHSYFNEINDKWEGITFNVYDTSNPDKTIKRVI